MSDLESRLDELAGASSLLVAADFDGTIAPIVSDPNAAEADRQALAALRTLARLPRTYVAIISGRALGDLSARTREVQDAHLVGSHGSEFDAGFATPLTDDARALLQRIKDSLGAIVSSAPGSLIEEKPASVAFHYRNANDEEDVREAVEAILGGPASWPGVHVRHGKKVVELSVVETDKGKALERLRHRLGATGVLFIGDDVTDEDAFAALLDSDVGIKVGPGETRARYRVANTIAVARFLARLADRRAEQATDVFREHDA